MIKPVIRKTTIVLCAALLIACDSKDSALPDKTTSLDYLDSGANYSAPYQADLLQNLPEQTIAYARIPELRGLLFGSQGSALQPAAAHEAIQQQWALIGEGLQQNLLAKINDAGIRSMLDLLVSKQQAPIEMALMMGKAGVLSPEVIINTRLEYDSAQTLTTFLQEAANLSNGQLLLTSEPDANGYFALSGGQAGINGHFDSESKSFVLHAGLQINDQTIQAFRGQSLETRSDAYDFERNIDTAGKGFAFWIDTQILWDQFSLAMPVPQRQMLEKLGLHEMAFAYLGNPSKDGHSSLTMMLQHSNPDQNPLNFSTPDQARDVKVSLPVWLAATLPMPNGENVQQAMTLVKEISGDDSLMQTYREAVDMLKEQHGFDLDKALGAFGPGGLLVNDRAGWWMSVPIHDRAAFDELIAWSVEYLGAVRNDQTIAGVEYTHYVLPNFARVAYNLAQEADPGQLDEADWLFSLLDANNSHFYWHHEESNLILGVVPQTLMARQRHLSNSTLNDWLNAHEVNWNGGLLSLLMESEKLPRRLYRLHLDSLQRLSSLAGVDANMFSMPLAEDLQLPQQGRLGFQFGMSAENIRFQLDYEESLSDYLFGSGSLAGIAAVGVVAAIAVPAYQNYAIRAEVSETLLTTAALKLPLAEFYIANGRFPDETEAEEYYLDVAGAEISFNAEQQVIEITFYTDTSELDGKTIWLIPETYEESILGWQCQNQDISEAQVPAECRY